VGDTELLVEHHEDLLGEPIGQPQFGQLTHEQRLVVLRVRSDVGRGYETRGLVDFDLIVGMTVPDRNVTEEICPSPVARKLSTKRRDPAGIPR